MRVGKIPPFGRDKDFSVTSFFRNDKIEEMITAYEVRGRFIESGMTNGGQEWQVKIPRGPLCQRGLIIM